MFKPTADNYEALMRALDYLNQIYSDVPGDDDVMCRYFSLAIENIENIFDELKYREYDKRSE